MVNKKPKPADLKLYEKVKKKLYAKIPKHSAYRSGLLVQQYKAAFLKKYGKNEKPYIGKKPTKKQKGIKRWFAEKWVNQRGQVGYQHKSDIYRPTKRITKKTPVTHGELTKKELKVAQKKKSTLGRVDRFRQKGGEPKRRSDGSLIFKDHLNFRPNLTPRQMFKMGSFGGTYWRPIYSSVLNKKLKNQHKKYPKDWWKGIPEKHLSTSFDKYDKKINKYGVKVGTTLEFWESKDWIKKSHPYGWVQWYCDFYNGKRSVDDKRQIMRWNNLTGSRGRFKRFLVSLIIKKGGVNHLEDYKISPKIRQVLQHWGYKLTKKDFLKEVKRRKKK
tara:strand:+ start:390 stop:1376 length:987 start_codon:yes stop_codon:yes gene_type:complete